MKRLPKIFGCPVELSIALLRGKWKPVILARLKDGPLRYGELRRLIPDISDKVLTERLADLQALGFIEPLRADGGGYRLTQNGESARPLLQALYDWGSGQAEGRDVIIRTDVETAGQ